MQTLRAGDLLREAEGQAKNTKIVVKECLTASSQERTLGNITKNPLRYTAASGGANPLPLLDCSHGEESSHPKLWRVLHSW